MIGCDRARAAFVVKKNAARLLARGNNTNKSRAARAHHLRQQPQLVLSLLHPQQPPPPQRHRWIHGHHHHHHHCSSSRQFQPTRTRRQQTRTTRKKDAFVRAFSSQPQQPAARNEQHASTNTPSAAATTTTSTASSFRDDDSARRRATRKPPPSSSSVRRNSNSSRTVSDAARRRQLGPACAQWLRRDPSWRRRVYELLELSSPVGQHNNNNNPNSNHNKNDAGKSLLRGNNNNSATTSSSSFYQDSIPSFVASLKKKAASPVENDDLPTALDKMVAVGLHRPHTLQNYHRHLQWQSRVQELQQLQSDRTRQLQYLRQAQAAAEEELAAWQERLDALLELQQKQQQQQQKEEEEGLLSRTIKYAVRSVMGLGGEKTTSTTTKHKKDDDDTTANQQEPSAASTTVVPDVASAFSSKKSRRLGDEVAERLQILERQQTTIDALQRTIDQLEQEQTTTLSPSVDEHATIQKQIDSRRRQLRNMVRAREALQDEMGRLQRQLQVLPPLVSTLPGSSSRSSNSSSTSQHQSCDAADAANHTALSSAFCVPLNGTSTKHDSATADAGDNIMDPQKLQEEIDRMRQKIDNRRAMVERHQSALDAVQVQLSQLNDELDPARLPLTPAQVAAVEAAAAQARDAVCTAFAAHVRERHAHLLAHYRTLDRTTDLTRPPEWFLRARLGRRRVVFHGGPTNSGKTYAALRRLKEAPRGAYLGPLRLLAAEVYEGLTAEGVYCNLYTGQERREIPFATHSSSTVEMASLTQDYDVIVLDEIQMLADSERGFAWTRALLGSRCPEIHVCGGLEAVDVVRRLAQACGDDFELHRYERFSELRLAERSLAQRPDQLKIYGERGRIQPGDCVVAFSRDDIFAIKREIESKTPHKCCVIYGSLPPSTRSGEARRFNDPDSGYDVLVASDAIGMGLNLNIRRIIFNSIYKNDGSGIVKLDHSAIKQIAGRAGRRNSPYPQGEVTTRDPRDLPYLHECMKNEIKPISKAGLLPTAIHIETFSNALEEYGLGHGPKNLHKVLLQFNDMASVQSDYFVCRQADMVNIAQQLADLDLSIADKYLFCLCPVQNKNPRSTQVMRQFARKLASGEVAGLSHNLIPRKPASLDDLTNLCHLYSSLELFLWLQKKFPPGNLMEQHTALSRRDTCVDMIGKSLASSEKLKISHCYVMRDKSLRRKIDGDSSARVNSNKIINYDEYYSDEEEEQWDDGGYNVRRWI